MQHYRDCLLCVQSRQVAKMNKAGEMCGITGREKKITVHLPPPHLGPWAATKNEKSKILKSEEKLVLGLGA